METAATYKIGNATVRIHGSYDLEKIKRVTTAYLKKVDRVKRKQLKTAIDTAENKGA